MLCTRCNYSFEGETCPICNTTVSKEDINKFNKQQNNDTQFFGQNNNNNHNNNNVSKCLRCGHTYLGDSCSNCGYSPNINSFNQQQSSNHYPIKKAPSILPSIFLTLGIILLLLISILLTLHFVGEDSLKNFGLLPKDPIVENDSRSENNSSDSSSVEKEKSSGKEIINKNGNALVNGISYSEYQKIKKGMTYAEISYIVGGDGQLANEGKNNKGKTEYTFVWPGENNNEGYVTMTFVDKKLTKITQKGIFE